MTATVFLAFRVPKSDGTRELTDLTDGSNSASWRGNAVILLHDFLNRIADNVFYSLNHRLPDGSFKFFAIQWDFDFAPHHLPYRDLQRGAHRWQSLGNRLGNFLRHPRRGRSFGCAFSPGFLG